MISALLAIAMFSSPAQSIAPRFEVSGDPRFDGQRYGTVRVQTPGGGTLYQNVRVVMRAIPTDETKECWRSFVCTNTCNGNVHDEHSECDTSCDSACTREHKFPTFSSTDQMSHADRDRLQDEFEEQTMEAMGESQGWEAGEGRSDGLNIISPFLSAGFRATSWGQAPFGQTVRRREEDDTDTPSTMTYYVEEEHFNTQPCSSQVWEYDKRKHIIEAKCVFFTMSYPGGGRRVESNHIDGPWIKVNEMWILGNIPTETEEPVVSCACESSETSYMPYDGGVRIGEDVIPLPQRPQTGTGLRTASAFTESVNQLGGTLSIMGQDLNYMNISFTGMDVHGGGLVSLPAGTVFVSEDSDYQDMVLAESVNWDMAFYVSTEPMLAQARVMCLNMTKKEPDDTVRFHPVAPNTDSLRAAARIKERSRFRGPWDQARMWVATDYASLKDINDRLFPPVSPRRYQTGLFELAENGAADLDKDRVPKLIELRPVFEGLPIDAARWSASYLAFADPKRFESQLKGLSRDFSYLDEDGSADRLAAIIEVAVGTGKENTIVAALELLESVPNARRAKIPKKKLHVIGGAFFVSNKTTMLALDVAEDYDLRGLVQHVSALTADDYPDEVRKRASSILAAWQ